MKRTWIVVLSVLLAGWVAIAGQQTTGGRLIGGGVLGLSVGTNGQVNVGATTDAADANDFSAGSGTSNIFFDASGDDFSGFSGANERWRLDSGSGVAFFQNGANLIQITPSSDLIDITQDAGEILISDVSMIRSASLTLGVQGEGAAAGTLQVDAIGVATLTTQVVDVSDIFKVPTFTIATLPNAGTAGRVCFISDETGGATLAYDDGTNWRRVADRAVVS